MAEAGSAPPGAFQPSLHGILRIGGVAGDKRRQPDEAVVVRKDEGVEFDLHARHRLETLDLHGCALEVHTP